MKTFVVSSLLAGLALTALSGGAQASAIEPTLAFASYRSNDSAIYSVSADGTNLKRLTTTPNPAFEGEPAYSPDGGRIAYVCGNFELCVMNADGSKQGRLTTSHWPQTWDYVNHPSWSPDGTKIAFSSNSDGRYQIYVVKPDGSALTKLAASNGNDEDPSWSPDGTQIAFDSYRGNGNAAIYVMNADGTLRQKLTSGTFDDAMPAWSPDGKRLVYQEYDDEDTHLMIMNADGSRSDSLTEGFCDEFDPAWSPFGATLAFERNCDGKLGIEVGDFSRIDDLTAPPSGFDLYPAWRPTVSPTAAQATPSAPVSAATGDARIAGAYFTWGIQVAVIDYSLDASAHTDRKTIIDDEVAIADLSALQADTAKGSALQRDALKAFKLDIAASKKDILGYQAAARGKRQLARKYFQAAGTLVRQAEGAFSAADALAATPY